MYENIPNEILSLYETSAFPAMYRERTLTALLLAVVFLTACKADKTSAPTDRPNAAVETGVQQFESWVADPTSIPFTFVYDSVAHEGLKGLEPLLQRCETTPAGKALHLAYRLDPQVEVRVDAALNAEFGQTEYTVWFENKGTEPSGELTDLRSVSLPFQGGDPVVRGCLGDHGHLYADYVMPLRDTVVRFAAASGRATHWHFP